MIIPLAEALEVFTYGKNKHVDNVFHFVATFRKIIVNQSRQIESEEMALENSMFFLFQARDELFILKKSLASNSSFSLSNLFSPTRKLINAIDETQEKMGNLIQSIKILLQKSSTGNISLMLHNL